MQVTVPDARDRSVERGREHQPLPVGRRLIEQPANRGEEPEVGHEIGFVEHGDADPVERALALGDQVLEASGSGDEDVDASAERGGLRALRDATEHRRATQSNRFGERCDRAGDLRRELAGGDEHERTRAGGCPSIVGSEQRAREGHREGDRLAAAGASTAEDVTPCERVRQGRRLDGERSRDPGAGERGCDRSGHAQRGERRRLRCGRLRCERLRCDKLGCGGSLRLRRGTRFEVAARTAATMGLGGQRSSFREQ